MDDEIAPVLLVLSAPDELRIEIGVTLVTLLQGLLLVRLEEGLKLCCRDVLPLIRVVFERLDGLGGGFLSHRHFFPVSGCAVADSIILLNSLSTLVFKSASIW